MRIISFLISTVITLALIFALDNKWGSVPPRYLVLQRNNVGVVAILGRLNATANWRRIAWELWPITDGPPSTELGRQEAAWWAEAQRHAPAAPTLEPA